MLTSTSNVSLELLNQIELKGSPVCLLLKSAEVMVCTFSHQFSVQVKTIPHQNLLKLRQIFRRYKFVYPWGNRIVR